MKLYNTFMTEGEEKPPTPISKRSALKLAGVVAGTGALAWAASRLGMRLPGSEAIASPEKELKPSVFVPDVFDLEEFRNNVIKQFPEGFSETQELQEMGVSDSESMAGLQNAVPKDENQTRLFMLKALEFQYKDHGKNVIEVMRQTADFLKPGQKFTDPSQTSIATAVQLEEIQTDALGNPTARLTLSEKIFDGMISQTDASVINMSFELGSNSITYTLYEQKSKYPEIEFPSKSTINGITTYRDHEGNYITEEVYNEISAKKRESEVVQIEPHYRDIDYVDGYYGESTYDNLLKLAQIAKKYPEKMFVAAGGNPTLLNGRRWPDIREARAKLEAEGLWKDNIIIVGFLGMDSGVEGLASYGADVYVSHEDLERFGFSQASSYATPVITEVIRQLIVKGLNTHKKVRAGLMQMTEINTDSEIKEYKLLNLDNAKKVLQHFGMKK